MRSGGIGVRNTQWLAIPESDGTRPTTADQPSATGLDLGQPPSYYRDHTTILVGLQPADELVANARGEERWPITRLSSPKATMEAP